MEPVADSQIYARLGEDGFDRLIAAFYARVRRDDVIGPLYPPDEWVAAQARLRDFLIQRFGGPTTYSDTRGHPRLRMRHMPFSIGPAERDRWLELMRDAMTEAGIEPDVAATLWPYFVQTASFMMNRQG
jgi:hemoglobin